MRAGYGKHYLWKCIYDCGAVVYRLPDKLRSDVDSACDDCLKKTKVTAMVAGAGFVEGTQLPKIQNNAPTAANTSGVRGVFWNKRTQKWRAMICFQKQNHYLGEYSDFADAVKARQEAEEKYFAPVLENYRESHTDT